MLEAAIEGLNALLTIESLIFLGLGIFLGVFGGIVPGAGGPSALAVTLPFVMLMSPVNAIAFLIGMSSVGNTANTFTSVLVAVPGGSGSQATVLDGYPMAQRGEARRALSASFLASMLGGIIGVTGLFLSLPILAPLIRSFGSPELFMFTLWGISMVGIMSSGTPIKGMTAGILGVLVSTIGQDVKSGVMRFDIGYPYLWGGISIILVSLSVFAIPEAIGLASRKKTVADPGVGLGEGGILKGIKDVFVHWWLTLRCAVIGIFVGVLPGLGSSVADWFAYAHARQTVKNPETFGTGDIRGVIAPEASNNGKEGGDLIPTLFFGIPGGSSTALLLVAFIAVGLQPGPAMAGSQLHYTFTILWALAVAQIVAALLCWSIIKPASRACYLPFFVICPIILMLAILSSFAANFVFDDILILLVLSIFGFLMKAHGWPRAPFVLGFILGPRMELYLWLSVSRYSLDWLLFPGVIIMGLIIAASLLYPVFRHYSNKRKARYFQEKANSEG